MCRCSHASTSGNGCDNDLNYLNYQLFPINFHSHAILYAAKISASLNLTRDS